MDAMEIKGQDREAPFGFEELFFSRTDAAGIIKAGNSVFQRISQYGWGELMDKPHKLIRHPDMPRGVFYLFWDFLKRGKPIGAYVKNRARDGSYYWVFAIATPMEGGYLSVRLKPSSEIFPVVQDTYKWLLELERREQLSPRDSAARLLEKLASMGFASYEEFMSIAVRGECMSRDKHLERPADPLLARFERLSEMAETLRQETTKLCTSYEANRYVPLNLQIQSCQLGEDGKTIGVISNNYTHVSAEMRQEISSFAIASGSVFDAIFNAQFLLCTASVQAAVAAFFETEDAESGMDRQGQMEALRGQIAQYQRQAGMGLRKVIENVDAFQEDCQRMKMIAASLEVIRVMGKVDTARLTRPVGALNELIDDLREFQASISRSLVTISRANCNMQADTQAAIRTLEAA